MSTMVTAAPIKRSSGSAGRSSCPNSQDAVREFRPYFDNAPVYGHGPSLESFTRETPLTVGSPQQVIDKALFKSFIDVLEPDALRDKPIVLAATGGTERHSLTLEHALRPLFSHLAAAPVSTSVYAATADFGGPGSAALAGRVERPARELAAALISRPQASKRDQEPGTDSLVPFEQMLARLSA